MLQSHGKLLITAENLLNKSSLFFMIRTIFLVILSLLISGAQLFCQTDERILIRINDTGITAEEFIRLYTKNTGVDDQPDFDNYFNQFIIFRLKVAQAIEEGIDTTSSFKREFEGYKSQLARNYLTDNEAREKLLKEVYSRLQFEVNAWHILIECRPEATPDDTLTAYKKAMEVRVRLLQEEPFEIVARAVSDDPSSLTNGGNLGWFTATQMILPFEDAVYNMKIGDISMPVRTPYGYHIIKLTGKRSSSGMVKVAHIMKALPPGASEDAWQIAENEINTIYNRIIEGADFAELAKTESDHRETALRGGELEWFRTGDIVQEFTDAAFSLSRNGDISKPVKTPFGWHIIKRLDRKPLGSFEDNRAMLETRLSESHLNSIASRSLVEKLKKEYNYSENSEIVDWFIVNTDTLADSGKNSFYNHDLPKGNLFEFDGGKLTSSSFVDLTETNLQAFNGSNAASLIRQMIDNRASEMLLAHEESQLEKKYPDFRFLIKEFHDGMLLFEINSREVWNKPYTDSTGLLNFYRDTREQYMGEPSADVTIYSLKKPGNIRKLARQVSRLSRKTDGDKRLLEKFNSENDTTLIITSGRYSAGEYPELDRYLRRRGTSIIDWQDMQSVLAVTKTYPAEPKPLEEVRMEVSSAYQDYLEEKWVIQLKKQYPVWVNEPLLKEIKMKLDGRN
jgi:peptidyl-prolyl cis-trans isomerase SurA